MIAWVDCSAGIAGDMLLGALLDAGADLEAVRRAVRAVHPGLDVTLERTQRHQIDCAKATVVDTSTGHAADHPSASPDETASHHHHHHHHDHQHHHHQQHRSWREVRALLDAADLDETVRQRAHATFEKLAEAEGSVHGMDPDDVHFHEVGALDAIGDVVGCAAAFVDLGVTSVTASTVTVGHGEQTLGEHGRIPVPGPAVTHLARAAGMPVTGGPVALEMTTPTGAALLAAWVTAYAPLPELVVDRVGLGAGTRDPERLANLVRVVVGRPHGVARDSGARDQLVRLDTNVDDLDPRLWPVVLDDLLDRGALDAWLTPIVMKKGRPAHELSVLCESHQRGALIAAIGRLTSTLGVREQALARHAFDRRLDRVEVEGQAIDVKVKLMDGHAVTAQPEFDHCVRAAATLGVPVAEVVARASARWWQDQPAN